MFDELAEDQQRFREKIFQFFARPSNPRSLKAFGILFLVSMMILGGITLAGSSAFHSVQTVTVPRTSSVNDPYTYLWKTDLAQCVLNGPNSEFNTQNAMCRLQGSSPCPAFATVNCLELNPNSSVVGPAIVLTKVPVDISTVTGKELGFDFAFNDISSTAKFQTIIYLTENNTVNTSTSYSPFTDKQVSFLISYDATSGSGSASIGVFERLKVGETILAEDTNCTGSDSSCLGSYTNPVCQNGGGSADRNILDVLLNFTGSQTNGGGISTATGQVCNGARSQVTIASFLPRLQTTSIYYLGFYENIGGAQALDFQNDNLNTVCVVAGITSFVSCMSLVNAVPTPPSQGLQGPQPTIDTGGFFGGLIRALISIGVFIAQNVISFFGFLSSLLWPTLVTVFTQLMNALKIVLNAIGQFFGIGNIGDLVISFFNGVGSFLSNIVVSAFAQIVNVVNLFVQVLTWLGSLLGGPIWTGIIGIATTLASGWSTIVTAYGFLTQLSTNGLLGINYYFLLDWFFGMFLLSVKGMEGFKTWVDLNGLVFEKIAKATYFFIKESVQLLIWIKQTVVNWT